MNTQPRTVDARLAHLERTSSRWRLAAVGLAGLLVGGAVVGFGPERRDDYELMDEYLLWLAETTGSTTVPRVVEVVAWGNTTDGRSDKLCRFWSNGLVEVVEASDWAVDSPPTQWFPIDSAGSPNGHWLPLVGAD